MDKDTSLLLRQPEAARLLGISVQRLRLVIAAGRLQTVELHPGGWPRVRRADVEALARGERPAGKNKASP